MNELYYHFIRYSLNIEDVNIDCIRQINWSELLDFSRKQAIIGIIFEGIKKLSKECAPPSQVIYNALATYKYIEQINLRQNITISHIFQKIRQSGFECCLLKGQGNALLYPNPLSRAPGDIDIWVNAHRKAIKAYVCDQFSKIMEIRYNHIQIEINGFITEIHFIPGMMNNPFYNYRLQKWFKCNARQQCSNQITLFRCSNVIAIPQKDFNIIFQLSHIYHHFFDQGIGLKQLMDYYFLLKSMHDMDKEKINKLLKYLGLINFAKAVMYIMKVVFNLPEEQMFCPIDIKRGEILKQDMEKGGNFGHYNKCFTQYRSSKFIFKSYRILHFLRYFPTETICEPIFRLYHYFWRTIQ